jgi:hypothetical protein
MAARCVECSAKLNQTPKKGSLKFSLHSIANSVGKKRKNVVFQSVRIVFVQKYRALCRAVKKSATMVQKSALIWLCLHYKCAGWRGAT